MLEFYGINCWHKLGTLTPVFLDSAVTLYRRSIHCKDDPRCQGRLLFTLWLLLSTWFLLIEFVSSSAHIIGTIHLIIQGRQGLGTLLGSPPVFSPVEIFRESNPHLLLAQSFEETLLAWLLLLTLTKLGGNSWTRTNDRLRMKQLH